MASDPTQPVRHLSAAAMLILALRGRKRTPDDHIALVELANGYRIEAIAHEKGKPVRLNSHHERQPLAAVKLAEDFKFVSGFEIRIFRLGASQ